MVWTAKPIVAEMKPTPAMSANRIDGKLKCTVVIVWIVPIKFLSCKYNIYVEYWHGHCSVRCYNPKCALQKKAMVSQWQMIEHF